MEKGLDVGETRKPVSHKHYKSLKATRRFDSKWFTGASKRDTREDWPKGKVKRNFEKRYADELGHVTADDVETNDAETGDVETDDGETDS